MRSSIEAVLRYFRESSMEHERSSETKRYVKEKEKRDGSVHLLSAMLHGTGKYPDELVREGFGHGVKATRKGASLRHLFMEEGTEEAPEDSSQHEDSKEDSEKHEDSEEEYRGIYEDDHDTQNTENDTEEDVL
ncbi:hypothetical protein NEFER03_1530 [Nematocida sp. LUAm3]|nr:hypothetical protein NEFER03_1530 [Nematocida sp. LUAm3]KAI5174563.1 hypothetical protein NEFER02_0684 [Nematocida sp. LUAm2]KAI5178031.1 hypothetical protein NEFER01_1213 [Nematocida sp. LUAm1]